MAKKARQRISYGETSYPTAPNARATQLVELPNALLYALSFGTVADTGIVLENAKSSEGGHRLGVNGLAVDNDNAIL